MFNESAFTAFSGLISGIPEKTQFRVIIPESVTILGGGEEPKNVPSNFGVLQFYIILALALLTILSENFGFSVRRRLS